MLFRAYVTDALQIKWDLNKRWADMIQDKPKETRTAEEIKESIKEKIGRL